MKREFLKELGLEKEVIDKIMAENGNDITAEQEKFNSKIEEKNNELKVYKENLNKANSAIQSYKNMDVEKIKSSAEKYKADYEKAMQDFKDLKNSNALSKALGKTNAIDSEVIEKLLDKGKLNFKDDETIEGLEEQIKAIQENKPFLFKEEKAESEKNGDNRFTSIENPEQSNGDVNSIAAQLDAIFN